MIVDYKRIFQDILDLKFPEKSYLHAILQEREINNSYDVLKINRLIFGEETKENKHKSYDEATIAEILKYQHDNNLSNKETARLFQLSRNTVTSWKKKNLTAIHS